MADQRGLHTHSHGAATSHTQLEPEPKTFYVRVLEAFKEELGNPGELLLSDHYVPISQITARSDTPHIRLIACDHPTVNNYNSHLASLFRIFDVPSEIVTEEHRSVGHSFGVRDSQGYHDTWFRYLQKNLHVIRVEGGGTTVASATDNGEDYTWIKGGFYVHWNKQNKTVDVIIAAGIDSQVVRQVFSETIEYLQRRRNNFDLIVQNAYQIYAILWSQFFAIEDSIIWSLVAVIRTAERAVYAHAENQMQKGTELSYHLDYDFVNLHNLAKHANYLHETAETKMHSLKRIMESHEEFLSCKDNSEDFDVPVRRNLRYYEDLMRGLASRVETMERRINNIVNLAFQLTTQLEARAAQKDSTSLKTVSYLTLFFLPGTAVASVFGSNFFSFDVGENGRQSFYVSNSFWIFWVVVFAITAITLIIWRINNWMTMKQLRERVSNPRRRMPRQRISDVANMGFALYRTGNPG